LTPGYEELRIAGDKQSGLRLVASRDGRDGSLTIHQDADLYLAALASGERVAHPFRSGRHGWLQVLRGEVRANGTPLTAGDGAAIRHETRLEVEGVSGSEVLLFDLS
jgi:hypothetical protein